MKIVSWAGVALVALALGIAAAGCGSSSGSASSPAAGTSGGASSSSSGSAGYGYGGPAKAAGAMSVKLTDSTLGKILVDGEGKTLYLFEADTANKSNCSGGCIAIWPPVTTDGAPSAGTGVVAGMLGTTKRDDGTSQITYAGHPLYWYAGDTKAGDAAGEGLTDFGGAWYAVSAAGEAVEGNGS
jgi:predicted lipoprotein with Yx(FWY)xxD motif